MYWQVCYLVDNKPRLRARLTLDEAIDLACRLIGEDQKVLSIRDAKAQGSPIYGAEIVRLYESRK
jgi:hypothetical protein